jgi:hypothetical protein
LILAPPTATPEPLLPTAIPPTLPAPGDIVVTHSAATPLPEEAQAIVDQILADFADDESPRLLLVERVLWTATAPNCADNAGWGYRVILVEGETFYEYHSNGAQIMRCPSTGETLSVAALLAIDPVAAEMAALAQRRVAENLDLPTRSVQIVDVRPISWLDSSLGCPLPDQQYTPMHVDGYRIVVAANDTEYIFHSDFNRIIPCAAEDEALP